jgi:hypothetical protein
VINAAVPVPTCGEMQSACLANLREAEAELPGAERKFLEACDAVRAWVELDGRGTKDRLLRSRDYWHDRVTALKSDKRHWLLQGQAWRDCLKAHPELSGATVGARCACGYVAPMCALDRPVLKQDGGGLP